MVIYSYSARSEFRERGCLGMKSMQEAEENIDIIASQHAATKTVLK